MADTWAEDSELMGRKPTQTNSDSEGHQEAHLGLVTLGPGKPRRTVPLTFGVQSQYGSCRPTSSQEFFKRSPQNHGVHPQGTAQHQERLGSVELPL